MATRPTTAPPGGRRARGELAPAAPTPAGAPGGDEVNVNVLLRCRPTSSDETRMRVPQVIRCKDEAKEVVVSQAVAGKTLDRTYQFDKVFGPGASQSDVYTQAVHPIVTEVLEGFNCTIFAYGQTGTGKTHTILGDTSRDAATGLVSEGAGVIPRAVEHIFESLESANAEYSVKVTFLELYNEEITDLLGVEDISSLAPEKRKLALMEDGKRGVIVRGLEEVIVKNSAEIFSVLESGSAKRRTAETLLNKQSSRSHSVFTVTIHIKESTPEGEELIKCGKLNLVDLAGSENVSRSGARDGRAREAGEINKSLLTLGRVITALVDKMGHVPYRDSKLTRLLRDALGGSSKTCIIATVAPSVNCLEETLSTLDYAHRAKNIRNKPEVNQKMTKTALIKDMVSEIDKLKADLVATREKHGVYLDPERYQQEQAERTALERRCTELEEQIAELQRQLGELEGMFQGQKRRIAELNTANEKVTAELGETKTALDMTASELETAKGDIEEKDYLLDAHEQNEQALATRAEGLAEGLRQSVSNTDKLFGKLDRVGADAKENAAAVEGLQGEVADRLKETEEAFKRAVQEQAESRAAVESGITEVIQKWEEDTNSLRSMLSDIQGQLADKVGGLSEAAGQVASGSKEAMEGLGAQAREHVEGEQETLENVSSEMVAAMAAIKEAVRASKAELAGLVAREAQALDDMSAAAKALSAGAVACFEKLGEAASEMKASVKDESDLADKAVQRVMAEMEQRQAAERHALLNGLQVLVDGFVSREAEVVKDTMETARAHIAQVAAGVSEKADEVEAAAGAGQVEAAAGAGQVAVTVPEAGAEAARQTAAEELQQRHASVAASLDAAHASSTSALQAVLDTSELLTTRGAMHTEQFEASIARAMETVEAGQALAATLADATKEEVGAAVSEAGSLAAESHATGSEAARSAAVTLSSAGESFGAFAAAHQARLGEVSGAVAATTEAYRVTQPTGETPVRSQASALESQLPETSELEGLRTSRDGLLQEFRKEKAGKAKEPVTPAAAGKGKARAPLNTVAASSNSPVSSPRLMR